MTSTPIFRHRITIRLLAVLCAAIALAGHALADDSASQKSLESRTVDFVKMGDNQSESDHHLQGDTTGTRPRFADANAWFSYDLKVHTNGTQSLAIEFAGNGTGEATADVMVGTNKLGSIQASGSTPTNRSFWLGPQMIRRGIVTVKFVAPTNSPTPGVLSLRVFTPEPTLASMSKTSSSRTNYPEIARAMNDLRDPWGSKENSNRDRNAKAHFDWWPARATNQWVQYDFPHTAKVSAVEVYWYNDSTTGGGCAPPKSWQLLYRVNGEWKPVANPSAYGVEEDKYNRTTFDAVETDGLRLDVRMPDRNSAGVMEWKVEEAKP